MVKSAIAQTSHQVDWGFQATAIGTAAKQAVRALLYDGDTRQSNPFPGEVIKIFLTVTPGNGVGYTVEAIDVVQEEECDCGRQEAPNETGEGRQEEEVQEESGKGQEPAAVPSVPAKGVLVPQSEYEALLAELEALRNMVFVREVLDEIPFVIAEEARKQEDWDNFVATGTLSYPTQEAMEARKAIAKPKPKAKAAPKKKVAAAK